MTGNTTLIICPDHNLAATLKRYYAANPLVRVKGPSVTGHRADTVVVLPISEQASDRDKATWETLTKEHFVNRVDTNGTFVAP